MVLSFPDIVAGLPALCGYGQNSQPATEPTALAALAHATYGQIDAALPALEWLASIQSPEGCLGISAAENSPCWPTALGMLAWSTDLPRFEHPLRRATSWLLAARGKPQPRSKEMGHDSTLVGWPWVLGTHSWLEPTAWSVLALKAVGHWDHARTREAVRLLVDRLLPGGGCNYGNTTVLGQLLRPHLQPTGLVLMALAGEGIRDVRVAESLDYLERELSQRTATSSLGFGLMGLAAHGRRIPSADNWLALKARQLRASQRMDWRVALIALAAFNERSLLLSRPTKDA